MIKIVKELIKALRQHIKKLDWMEEKTKKRALLKLSKMRFKIGYPEKFEKFEEIKIFKHPVDMVIQLNNYNFKKSYKLCSNLIIHYIISIEIVEGADVNSMS